MNPSARSPLLDELRAIVRLGAPLALVSAGNQFMSLVDNAVVGRLGTTELGAVGLANALFFSFSIIGVGVVMGLDPLIAQALGAGDALRARRLLWQGVWLSLGIAAVLAIPVAATPLLLGPIGVPPSIAIPARDFLYVRLLGLAPFLVFFCLRSYVQALHRTAPLVLAMAAANLLNFALDVLLVFGGRVLPEWAGPLRSIPAVGYLGAAFSTTACLIVQVGLLALFIRSLPLASRPADLRRPVRSDLVLALKLGIPVGFQYGAEVGIFGLVALLAGALGETALAGHQIALTLASLTFTGALGFSAAGAVRVGWAVGGGDTPAARRSGLVAIAGGAGLMGTCAVFFLLFPRELAGLLSDKPDAIAAAVPLLGIAAVFQIFDGIQGVGAGVLRGAGDTRFAFLANLAGHYGVGLPVALVCGYRLGMGIHGLWYGLCAGLMAVGIALLTRFLWLSSRPIAPVAAGSPSLPS